MKQLLTILLILVSFAAFSQYADDYVSKKEKPIKTKTTIKDEPQGKLADSPGDCLIKASNVQVGAYLTYALGGVMMYFSASGDVGKSEQDACKAVGIACIAVGTVLQISHTILIGKAGTLMNEQQKSLTLKASPTGAGLAINF